MLKKRDLQTTKEVEVKGAKFVISMIPSNIYRPLAARLKAAGNAVDISKTSNKEDFKKGLEKMLLAEEETYEILREIVYHGVKGHSDIQDNDGGAVLFEKEKEGNPSQETLKLYDENWLIIPLGAEVMVFNILTEGERKN